MGCFHLGNTPTERKEKEDQMNFPTKLTRLTRLTRVLMTAAVVLTLFACGGNKFVAAAKTANVAASGIKIVGDINRAYGAEGEISQADELSVVRTLKEVNGSILQCVEAAQGVESFTPAAKTAMLVKCADISNRVSRLQSAGVIQAKSDAARKRLRQAMLGVSVAAEGLTTGIQLIPDAESAQNREAPRPPEEARALLNVAVQKLRENDVRFGDDISRLTPLRE